MPLCRGEPRTPLKIADFSSLNQPENRCCHPARPGRRAAFAKASSCQGRTRMCLAPKARYSP